MTFSGHKHNAKTKAAIAAGSKARWERYWAQKQAEENEWAAANGLEPENVLNRRRPRRTPAEMAERREARAFRKAQNAEAEATRAERRAFKAELVAIQNGVTK